MSDVLDVILHMHQIPLMSAGILYLSGYMKLASLSNASPNTFIALQSHSPKTFKYFSLYTCNDGRHSIL